MTSEKQFARAKAIAVLECMAIDLTGALASTAKTNPMADVLEQRLEAIDTAQAALRGQEHIREDTNVTTNADHIRSMTDEELGSVLFGALSANICPNGCDNCDGDCDKHTLDWLKQPYKEDT